METASTKIADIGLARFGEDSLGVLKLVEGHSFVRYCMDFREFCKKIRH